MAEEISIDSVREKIEELQSPTFDGLNVSMSLLLALSRGDQMPGIEPQKLLATVAAMLIHRQNGVVTAMSDLALVVRRLEERR